MIIGAVAGAYLPDVMSSSKLKDVDPDAVLNHPPRDAQGDETIEELGEEAEELGEDVEDAADDAAETIDDTLNSDG